MTLLSRFHFWRRDLWARLFRDDRASYCNDEEYQILSNNCDNEDQSKQTVIL